MGMRKILPIIVLLLSISLMIRMETLLAGPSAKKLRFEPEYIANPIWVLVSSMSFNSVPTTIGYLHSSKYLRNELTIKFSGLSEIKTSIDGGPLTVEGTVSFSYSVAKTYVQANGSSARIVYDADYVYRYYENDGEGPPFSREVWRMTHFDPFSGRLRYVNVPSQPHGTKEGTLYLGANILSTVVRYDKLRQKTITIGASAVLTGSWKVFSGSVPIGASISLTNYNSTSAVYKLTSLDPENEHQWEVYFDGWVISFVFKK